MKKNIALILLMFVFITSPAFIGFSSEYPIAFSISILTPKSSPARNQWSLLMEQVLPKIGIGVSFHEQTNLYHVSQRTWRYPYESFDYIPTYQENGYDLLFIDQFTDIDWNPSNFFSTNCLSPKGQNFYQYSNPNWDEIIYDYLTTNDTSIQENRVKTLQAILYEDLPTICIIYPKALFGLRKEVSGIDPFLLSIASHRPENWNNTNENLTYCLPNGFCDMNAFRLSTYSDKLWMNSIYGSLFKREQNHHEWVSEIAKNFEVSSDRLNITINLDTNAKYSDGSSVIADDVAFTYSLHMTPKVKSPQYGILTRWLKNNNSIEVVDNDTVIFHLKKPNNFFLSMCSLGLVDKSSVEPYISSEGYEIFDHAPLSSNASTNLLKSCGPFALSTYGETIHLSPNLYWNNLSISDGDPLLNELIFCKIEEKYDAIGALINQDVDILDFRYYPDWTDFVSVLSIEGVLANSPVYEELAINLKHPVLGTGELTPIGSPEASNWIRKAISYAIPRQIIIEEILNGLGSPGVVPMSNILNGFDDTLEPYPYDLDLAIYCMEKAGFYGLRNAPNYDSFTIYRTTGIPIIVLLILMMFLSVTSIVMISRIRNL
ncbi:MAG: ABC transporter substrate-binding protein [Candidatus Heimdallarchaeaceae archaeon]|jgi:ABC-type transport system substrate-binding protein